MNMKVVRLSKFDARILEFDLVQESTSFWFIFNLFSSEVIGGVLYHIAGQIYVSLRGTTSCWVNQVKGMHQISLADLANTLVGSHESLIFFTTVTPSVYTSGKAALFPNVLHSHWKSVILTSECHSNCRLWSPLVLILSYQSSLFLDSLLLPLVMTIIWFSSRQSDYRLQGSFPINSISNKNYD